MSAYQPIWRNGRVLEAGERGCADRYEAIRDVLATLDEPFTVLDLGAAQGYFAARAAEDFDCRVTAIDTDQRLADAASERVDVRIRRISARRLRGMGRRDVVLALSVLHHFAYWRQVLAQVRACRAWAVIEVPHPDERWMRHAAARRELRQLHDAVEAVATRRLGVFERTGRDGSVHGRPMFLVPGTVQRLAGEVFSGSGTNSRLMPQYSQGLEKHLGYRPVPGSLNLRMDHAVRLGAPALDWTGRKGRRTRDYQFWPAWVGKVACHAMVPGNRGHGPECLELVAPVRLRDKFRLVDGAALTVDVETP